MPTVEFPAEMTNAIVSMGVSSGITENIWNTNDVLI